MLEVHIPEFHGLFLVVSGGQAGADQGGLQAAFDMGVQTGGYAPKGWRTCRGPKPDLAKYGLVEHAQEDYPGRTRANVEAAYGTAIIASDPNSVGSRQTLAFCKRLKKPCKIFELYDTTTDDDLSRMSLNLSKWIVRNNVMVLNVAGNRDNFGTIFHYQMTYTIVMRALVDLQMRGHLVQAAL